MPDTTIPTPTLERAVLTAPEMCVLLGIADDQLYRQARLGRIPGTIHMGRRVVWSRAAVMSWLAGTAPEAQA